MDADSLNRLEKSELIALVLAQAEQIVALVARVTTLERAGGGVARALCASPDATQEVYAETCACGAALSPADQAWAPLTYADELWGGGVVLTFNSSPHRQALLTPT